MKDMDEIIRELGPKYSGLVVTKTISEEEHNELKYVAVRSLRPGSLGQLLPSPLSLLSEEEINALIQLAEEAAVKEIAECSKDLVDSSVTDVSERLMSHCQQMLRFKQIHSMLCGEPYDMRDLAAHEGEILF